MLDLRGKEKKGWENYFRHRYRNINLMGDTKEQQVKTNILKQAMLMTPNRDELSGEEYLERVVDE